MIRSPCITYLLIARVEWQDSEYSMTKSLVHAELKQGFTTN